MPNVRRRASDGPQTVVCMFVSAIGGDAGFESDMLIIGRSRCRCSKCACMCKWSFMPFRRKQLQYSVTVVGRRRELCAGTRQSTGGNCGVYTPADTAPMLCFPRTVSYAWHVCTEHAASRFLFVCAASSPHPIKMDNGFFTHQPTHTHTNAQHLLREEPAHLQVVSVPSEA